jgi:hypothetical protein
MVAETPKTVNSGEYLAAGHVFTVLGTVAGRRSSPSLPPINPDRPFQI